MCINDSMHFGGKHPYLHFGDTYDAIRDTISMSGHECYEIPGFPPTKAANGQMNPGPYYRKSRFIPLSEIDELQIKKPEPCQY